MDFFNAFKGFFGFPKHNNQHNFENDDSNIRNPRDDFWYGNNRRSYFEEPNNNENNNNDEDMFFNIFSNPVEMHRYFEHQMNEMMKSFGMFGLGDGGNMLQLPPPGTEEFEQQQQGNGSNLRERYLKPGYEHPKDSYKKDTDLDGQVTLEDLDKSLSKPSTGLIPFEEKQAKQPQMRFFGQSFSSRIIHRPDGTQEIHKTIVDQDGNETKTVTKQRGDQQYTITTKTDKYGQKEITEDMINIDGKDLELFKQQPVEKKPHNWFPFDKLFK